MEAYPEDPNQEEVYYEPAPRRGMSGWLIALIVLLVLVVLCCICICAAGLLMGPAIGNVFSTVVETMEAMTPVP
jgi:hypothetical protein